MSEQNKDLVRRDYGQVVNGRDLFWRLLRRRAAGGRGAEGLFLLFPGIPRSPRLFGRVCCRRGTVSSFARR